ncbi:MAG: hypothetical protein ORN58_00915, partial [Sediminibacterium sp.]|nr:hypothetical protein [Sediminibacterium sp.]
MISCNEEIFGPKAAYWGNNNQVVLYNKNYKSDTNTVANLNSIFSNYVKNKCPNNVCPLYDSFPKDSNIILTTFYNDSILTYPHILDFYTGREEFYVGSYL